MQNMQGIYLASVQNIANSIFINLECKIEGGKFTRLSYNLISSGASTLRVATNSNLSGDVKYSYNESVLNDNEFIVIKLPMYNQSFYKNNDEQPADSRFRARYCVNLRELEINSLEESNIYQIIECDNFIYSFEHFQHNKDSRKLPIEKPKTKMIYIVYKERVYGKFSHDVEKGLIALYPEDANDVINVYNKNELTTRVYMSDIKDESKEHQFIYINPNYNYSLGKLDFVDMETLIEKLKKSGDNISLSEEEFAKIEKAISTNQTFTKEQQNLVLKLINEQQLFEKTLEAIIENILNNEKRSDILCREIIKNHYDKISEKLEAYDVAIKSKREELEQLEAQIERARSLSGLDGELATSREGSTEWESFKKQGEMPGAKSGAAIDQGEIPGTKADDSQEGYSAGIENQTMKNLEKMAINSTKSLSVNSQDYLKDKNIIDEAIREIERRYESSMNDAIIVDKMMELSSNYEEKYRLSVIREGILARENHLIEIEEPSQLISKIEEFITTKSSRDITYNEIANIIICISQGFLTIFAGEPGTGKTSLCNLIAKSLGLNTKEENNRFLEISVEKGWTSKSDFIGYYNHMTKKFDSTNSKVFDALTVLNEENKLKKENQDFEELPYLILLDEANLSPMEHYWADFMDVCDIDEEQEHEINLGKESYEVSNCLRFLATINYDHTTEVLSPRLLDRSWIILLEQKKLNINNLVNKKVINNEQIISFEALKSFINTENSPMPEPLVQRLDSIIEALGEQKISISPRVCKMIKNYCAVGDLIFKKGQNEELIALDYAVAQKIIPNIEGFGNEFKEFLVKFKDESLAGMEKSQKLLEKIIDIGDKNMKHYQFFAR